MFAVQPRFLFQCLKINVQEFKSSKKKFSRDFTEIKLKIGVFQNLIKKSIFESIYSFRAH